MTERHRTELRRMRGRLSWLVLGFLTYFGLVLAEVWVLAVPLALGIGLGMWWLMRQSMRIDRELFTRLEVKLYPEGCTCIRGAMLDNPSCPHHGEPEDRQTSG